jgi:hypothetical protein
MFDLLTSACHPSKPTPSVGDNEQIIPLVPQSQLKSVLTDIKHEKEEAKAEEPRRQRAKEVRPVLRERL